MFKDFYVAQQQKQYADSAKTMKELFG